jgi:hypothetical protein
MKSNPSSQWRRQRGEIDASHRELAMRQRTLTPAARHPSAEVKVIVFFTLLADVLSRAFTYFRIAAYLAFLAALFALARGMAPTAERHPVVESLVAVSLIRSLWIIIKREFLK